MAQYSLDGNAEIKTKTKLLKAIEWTMKNPLKIVIGVLGFIMFILVCVVGTKNTAAGVFKGQLWELEQERDGAIAEQVKINTDYINKMKGEYGTIYAYSEAIKELLYGQEDAINKMMQVYETTPDFITLYGDDRGLSGRLLKVYNNIEKTGGPFHRPLKYANAADI
jgi:hypothetical protein